MTNKERLDRIKSDLSEMTYEEVLTVGQMAVAELDKIERDLEEVNRASLN